MSYFTSPAGVNCDCGQPAMYTELNNAPWGIVKCRQCELAEYFASERRRWQSIVNEFVNDPLGSDDLATRIDLPRDLGDIVKAALKAKTTHYGHRMTVARAREIGDPIAHALSIGAVYVTRSSTGGAMWGVCRCDASPEEIRSDWWDEPYAFAGGAAAAAVRDAAGRGALVAIVDGAVVLCPKTTGIEGADIGDWSRAADQAKVSRSVASVLGRIS